MTSSGGRRSKPHPAANARAWALGVAAVAGVGLTVVFAIDTPATASSSNGTVTSPGGSTADDGTSADDTTTTTSPLGRRHRSPGSQTAPQPTPSPSSPSQRTPRSRSGGS